LWTIMSGTSQRLWPRDSTLYISEIPEVFKARSALLLRYFYKGVKNKIFKKEGQHIIYVQKAARRSSTGTPKSL